MQGGPRDAIGIVLVDRHRGEDVAIALSIPRSSHRALTRGLQLIRYSQDKPGLFAVSRFDPVTGREMLLLFNTSAAPVEQNVRVETRSSRFTALAGNCPAVAAAPGSVRVNLPALGYAVCDAR